MYRISGAVFKYLNPADEATISIKSAFETNNTCVTFETSHWQELSRITVKVGVWHDENLA